MPRFHSSTANFGSLIYTNLQPDYLNKSVPKSSTPSVQFKSKSVPDDLKDKFSLTGPNHSLVICEPKDNGALAVFLKSHLPAFRTGQTLYLNKDNDIDTVLGEGPVKKPELLAEA
jgi:hypothetical protein